MASTCLPVTQEAISAERKPGLADLLGSALATIVQEMRLRRDLRRLQALDDVMLRDIGLGRGELEHAVRHGRSGPPHKERAARHPNVARPALPEAAERQA